MKSSVVLLTLLAIASSLPAAWRPQALVDVSFDVVSVKRNVSSSPAVTFNQSPDGSVFMTNVSIRFVIIQAFPFASDPAEIVGLPSWARTERYDIRATSSLAKADAKRVQAMLAQLLVDRFGFQVRIEKREQEVFALVVARADGRLGPGMSPIAADCSAAEMARAAGLNISTPQATAVPDFAVPPPPCTMRTINAVLRDRLGDKQGQLGDLLEGETTMANLASTLRMWAGRLVIDRTDLRGSYRLRLSFDSQALRRGPSVASSDQQTAPSIFTALTEQAGLKLTAASEPIDTLIIDRLERPTENP